MSRFQRASHVLWHCQYHLVAVSGATGGGLNSCLSKARAVAYGEIRRYF